MASSLMSSCGYIYKYYIIHIYCVFKAKMLLAATEMNFIVL